MRLIDLSAVKDVNSEAVGFLDQVCDRLEFDHSSYATTNPVTGDVQGYANYSPDWILHYTKKGFHRVDPTLYQSARSIAPVDWSRFHRDEKFHMVFKDASDFGVTNRGITIPIRGPYGECGLFSVTRNCSDDEWGSLKSRVMGDLQMAAVHMHDSVIRSGTLAEALYQPNLSTREVEVLQWVAVGKSQQDIGDILSISHRTVEVHLRSGREKLGALTSAQAVGRAIGLGLVHPG